MNRKYFTVPGFTFIILNFLCVFHLFAQGSVQKITPEIKPESQGEHSHFGWAVALDKPYAFISAANETNEVGVSAGAVYVYHYEQQQWKAIQKLVPPAAKPYQYFGQSVAADSGVLIVGAIGSFEKGPFSGCAYIYRRMNQTWQLEQKVSPLDGAPASRFGQSVAICNDVALVGAYQATGKAIKSGAAYVFRFNGQTWQQEAKLTADDGKTDDFFGYAVDLNENQDALAGAYCASGKTEKSGAAYLFKDTGSTWKQVKKFVAGDGAARDHFGYSVSLKNEAALIGAYQNKNNNNLTGAAYLFKLSSGAWVPAAKWINDDGRHHDYFGISVDLQDNIAVVGASQTELDDIQDVGAACFYEKTAAGWRSTSRLVPSDGKKHDYFGLAVSLQDNTVLIGSRLNDETVQNIGAAYFFESKVSAVGKEAETPPDNYALYENYPNPFNSSTVLRFDLPQPDFVKLTIYDILGREIRTLTAKDYAAGRHAIHWDGTNDQGLAVASGTYWYKIKTNSFEQRKKMLLLK